MELRRFLVKMELKCTYLSTQIVGNVDHPLWAHKLHRIEYQLLSVNFGTSPFLFRALGRRYGVGNIIYEALQLQLFTQLLLLLNKEVTHTGTPIGDPLVLLQILFRPSQHGDKCRAQVRSAWCGEVNRSRPGFEIYFIYVLCSWLGGLIGFWRVSGQDALPLLDVELLMIYSQTCKGIFERIQHVHANENEAQVLPPQP